MFGLSVNLPKNSFLFLLFARLKNTNFPAFLYGDEEREGRREGEREGDGQTDTCGRFIEWRFLFLSCVAKSPRPGRAHHLDANTLSSFSFSLSFWKTRERENKPRRSSD